MTLQELLSAAKAAVADGDLEKADKLTNQAKALKAIQEMEPAPEPKETEADKALKAKVAELEAFKAAVEAEPPIAKAGVDMKVTEDETDKKAAKPWESPGHQLKAIRIAAETPYRIDERLKAQKAILGQNETVDSEGGFLVQTNFADQIFSIMHETSAVASRCSRWPMSQGNRTEIPAVDETSRAAGSRSGGIQAYWVAEGATITASSMDFRRIVLQLNKLAAVAYATEEILEDTAQLSTWVQREVPKELNFVLDDAIINGNGAGKPLGILNAAALVSVAKETGQAAATLVAENIVKMWSRAHARSRMNAVWLINQDIEPQLLTMDLPVGTGGIPVYLPPGGLSQSPYGTLMGRPVIAIEQAQTLGTVGDIMLADFSQYYLGSKTNDAIKISESMHVQFLTDQMTYKFTYRVDGQPAWNSALTPANGTNTQSPFVALATRS